MAEKFLSGKPCKRGHLSERLVSSRACCQCQSDKNRSVYEARREEIKAKTKAYRNANIDVAKAKQRAYRLKHLDEVNAKDRLRSQKPERKAKLLARLAAWNKANPERAKQRVRDWAKNNPGRTLARAARYRAAQRKATPAWADNEKIQKVYDLAARFRSLGCDFHVDHVIPLQSRTVCGLHVHNNLEIIEARANRSKSNQLHF